MAITACAPFLYPSFGPFSNQRNLAFGAISCASAGLKAAAVVQVSKTGSISHIHFRSGTVTSSGDVDARLETVSTTDGNPTGTLWGTNTNGTATISTANTWWRTALTAAASVTRGQIIALVVTNTTGNYQISLADTTAFPVNLPYGDAWNGSAWTKNGASLTMLLEYNDTTYPWIPGILPASSYTAVNLATTATPDEAGNLFTAWVGMRATGVAVYFDLDAAAEIVLYDSGGSVVAQVTTPLDTDIRGGGASGLHYYLFDSSVTLTGGATYRLILKPTTTTNVALSTIDVNAAGYMEAMPGGADILYTSRTDAGSFSQTSTRRALLSLIVDGFDSSSGGLAHLAGTGGLVG